MSYINVQTGPANFKKGIISFWFNVPKASLEKLKEVAEAERAGSGLPPPLRGILPLVTFGKIYEGRDYELKGGGGDGSYMEHHWTHDCSGWYKIFSQGPYTYSTGSTVIPREGDTGYLRADPSYVGILYIPPEENGGGGGEEGGGKEGEEGGGEGGGEKYYLAVRLQTASYGTPKMLRTKNSFFHSDINSGYATFPDDCGEGDQESHCRAGIGCTTEGVAPNNPYVQMVTAEDISSEVYREGVLIPDYFQAAVLKDITPDTWHHALVSFDLDHKTTATGRYATAEDTACDCNDRPEASVTEGEFSDPCKIFIALDNVNYTDKQLSRGYNLGQEHTDDNVPKGMGPNDWLSKLTLDAWFGYGGDYHGVGWGVTGAVNSLTVTSGGAPSYAFSGDVASSEGPLGIPASENFVDRILQVSMAEFLMFTDFDGEFDLSDGANRSHFIAPDTEGILRPTNGSPLYIPAQKTPYGEWPWTWDPGATDPAYAPPLFDPSAWPTGVKINGTPTTATIDFTKCQFNWQMGRSLGTLQECN